jgi:hypothetical protein
MERRLRVPVGSGKILNISAKLTARVIMLSRSNRPSLENINHFGFVLPKCTTNSCGTKYCN